MNNFMKKHLLFSITLLFLLAGCASILPGSTPFPTSVPIPTRTLAPTQPFPTAEPVPQPDPLAPTLFDSAWDDHSPFAPGLIRAEQDALGQRPGASVYHIDLTLSDDLTRLVGRQEVRYTNAETVPLEELYFRLFPNIGEGSSQIRNLTIDGQAVTPNYELGDSAMRLPLQPALPPGAQIVIGMDFTVVVPTEPGGNYGTFALLDDVLALAHFYPMIPVYDDEGWNVEIAPKQGDVIYADSSFYLVRVSAPAEQVILTSGSEIGRESTDGRQIVTYAAGPVRDFYIVSSKRYQILTETVGETTLNIAAPPELAEENELARTYAVKSFISYTERFGAYPFTELDVAGTPTLAGGVEYPGIVVVALAIYDRSNSFFEAATTHEVAHQWFYSTVGNDQIDEPWLDEALTQYATMLYYGDAHGAEGYNGFRRSMEGRWLRAEREDIPIGMPVAAYEGSAYGAIVYGRGPLFFEALGQEIGRDVLAAFLRDYYETFKYDIATAESLKALAEQHCGCDLTPIFEEWVY